MRNKNVQISKEDDIEVVITNGHDTNHPLTVTLGVFRLVCSNGLVVGRNFMDPIRIRHVGNEFYKEVAHAYDKVLAKSEDLAGVLSNMKSAEVPEKKVESFARESFELRMEKLPTPEQIKQILTPRRKEDESEDLWTVYNVVQENVIRGNFTYKVKKTDSLYSDYRAKPVMSPQKLIRINSGMWDYAAAMVA